MQGTAPSIPSLSVPPVTALTNTEMRKRQLAVGIGNFMEWFDFAIYGYFAAVIGAQFFPTGNPTTEMLASLAVFAVGFISRPLGALILGPIGDRHGRKAVLLTTVLGMGVTTALIGLTPSYAAIGVAGSIAVVILRFVQGMMVGGEWSAAATYLGESAPAHKRGLHASLITVTAGLAFLVGTGAALGIKSDPVAGGYIRLGVAHTVHCIPRDVHCGHIHPPKAGGYARLRAPGPTA